MRYLFPHCIVIVDERARYVETRFADGASIGSTPNGDRHSLELCAELGYDDTWEMSRDHELAHTWLAHLEGKPWSDTIWRIAHPDLLGSIGDDEVAEEEARVLEFQRRLDKGALRPWDVADIPVEPSLPW